MADVKWIKITTDIFDDEKIKIIDTYPSRDEILVVWFKLLALAGKCNKNGFLMMSDRVAYTNDMLSAIFNRDIKIIKLALRVFEQFGMIQISENESIGIVNWDKHQNIEGLNKIREQNRLRQAKYRERKKLQFSNNDENDVMCNVTSRHNNGTDIDKDIDKDKEKDIEKENTYSIKDTIVKNECLTNFTDKEFKDIIETWNTQPSWNIKTLTSQRKKSLNARSKEYGKQAVYDAVLNVIKSDYLQKEVPSWFSFTWFLKPTNFVKVWEGRYNGKNGNKPNSKQPMTFTQEMEQHSDWYNSLSEEEDDE